MKVCPGIPGSLLGVLKLTIKAALPSSKEKGKITAPYPPLNPFLIRSFIYLEGGQESCCLPLCPEPFVPQLCPRTHLGLEACREAEGATWLSPSPSQAPQYKFSPFLPSLLFPWEERIVNKYPAVPKGEAKT